MRCVLNVLARRMDAMDLVAFGEQEFRQIRAILTRNAGDECCFQEGILTFFRAMAISKI